MHSSASITSIRPTSWMQSTGQTSMQDLSLRSMQGSAMMYVTKQGLLGVFSWRQILQILANQFRHELRQPLAQHRTRHYLGEPGLARCAQRLGVGVLAEPEHRDPREAGDHVG